MTDIVSSKRRSAMMARIGPRNTEPELAVRSVAHRMGLRFRIHRTDLPGKPDIVFTKLRLAVFVHGCFWHRHPNCDNCTVPKTRTKFWTAKFDSNIARDQRNVRALRALGWKVLIIWECEANDELKVAKRLRNQLR